MDKTNRFKKATKRRAYETALRKATSLNNAVLWSPLASSCIPGPRDVVAKAIRVTRGRRRK